MQIQEYLKSIDLNGNEIKAYVANLELGEVAIMPIVKKSQLPRATVYYILERLRDRGLIEILQTSTRRIYIPHPPRKILSLLEKKDQKIKEDIDNLKDNLPELNQIYNQSPFLPKIKFYRDREIRQIYEDILKAPVDVVYYVSEIKKADAVLGRKFLRDWIARRIAKKIKTKAVWVRSQAVLDEPIYRPSSKNLRYVRYAPKEFSSPAHIMVYGDNVVVITTKEENIGVVISSRDFANSMKSWFRQLWKISK